jgi:LPXTG-motif cell wall-anchored protein
VSRSRRTRAAQLLGAAALTTTAVLGGAGSAHADSAGADPSPRSELRPVSTRIEPLLADTGTQDTGLLVVYAGLLVAAGGGALWALRRHEDAVSR